MPPGDESAWTVPQVFAYGLLRPGERYWPELEPAVRRVRPATVRGALHLHASGVYPLLDLDGDGEVVGDLLEVEDAPVVHALVWMELRAGYDVRWVEARTPDGPESVIAFGWPWGAEHRGPRIAGGDWTARSG